MSNNYIHPEIYFTQQLREWEKKARKPVAVDQVAEGRAYYYKLALRGLELIRESEGV